MKKYKFHLALFGIWALLIVIVNPMGDFPINDDWSYAHNVKVLTQDGTVYFSYWPAMTLFAQTLWATLFCKLFGFSFVVLRFATLVLAFGTSLAFFELLKRQMKDQRWAFLFTLILIGNPLFITQSFTFMTEVYYLFFGCMALIFYSNYFKNQKLLHLVIALIFTIFTIWVRQTGLIIPLGFGIAYLFYKKLNWRSVLVVIIPTIVGILSLAIYKEWRLSTGATMGNFSEVGALIDGLENSNFDYFIQRIGVLMHYAGFALIPISILILSRFKTRIRPVTWIIYIVVVSPFIYSMYSCWDIFPHGNVLNNFEIGPKLLKDHVIGDNVGTGLSTSFWNLFKLLNVLSILIFFHGLFTVKIFNSKNGRRLFGLVDAVRAQPFLFMMLIIVMGQFIYLIINPIFFDRYVIPMAFSFLIITGLLIDKLSKKGLIIGFSIAGLFLLTSSLLMRDFMSWQQARWDALNYLTEELKIDKTQIDGGFEFNAFHQVAAMAAVSSDRRELSWWWVDQDNYLIASGDFLGYHKFRSYPCNQLISTTSDTVYILEKRGMIPIAYPLVIDFESINPESNTIMDSNDDALWEMSRRHTHGASKSGKYSVRLQKEDAYYLMLDNLSEGELIEISVWTKGKTGRLMIDNYGNDEFENIEVISKETGKWNLLKSKFTITKEMSGKQIVFYLSNNSNSPVYFDDVLINRRPLQSN